MTTRIFPPLFAAFVISAAVVGAQRDVTPEQLQTWLKRFPEADANGKLTAEEAQTYRQKVVGKGKGAGKAAASASRPTPTHANVEYGSHERNVLDLWLAKSDQPTPLVVFIHGGGFVNGDKSGALAVHDDLADPNSDDPVLRQSSRLAAAGCMNGQATYDMTEWERVVGKFRPEWSRTEDEDVQFYGFKSRDDFQTPEGKKILADCSMIGQITKDAPPIVMTCTMPDGEPENRGQLVHHPQHARAVQKRCEEVEQIARGRKEIQEIRAQSAETPGRKKLRSLGCARQPCVKEPTGRLLVSYLRNKSRLLLRERTCFRGAKADISRLGRGALPTRLNDSRATAGGLGWPTDS